MTISHGNLSKIKHEASMMGLFSTIDAMLDQSMTEALEGISLPKSVSDALLLNQGALEPIFTVIQDYEKGDWNATKVLAEQLGITVEDLSENYRTALGWAREIIMLMYD